MALICHPIPVYFARVRKCLSFNCVWFSYFFSLIVVDLCSVSPFLDGRNHHLFLCGDSCDYTRGPFKRFPALFCVTIRLPFLRAQGYVLFFACCRVFPILLSGCWWFLCFFCSVSSFSECKTHEMFSCGSFCNYYSAEFSVLLVVFVPRYSFNSRFCEGFVVFVAAWSFLDFFPGLFLLLFVSSFVRFVRS